MLFIFDQESTPKKKNQEPDKDVYHGAIYTSLNPTDAH